MKRLILLILICGLGNISIARDIDTKKLDTYLLTLETNNKFMGTISVSQNGEVIYSKSVGFADVDSKIEATDKSKYKIGSISKTFTAVMVFQLVEKGKLDLDWTLDRYFPSIKNASNITISQILYHRSGIHNFTANEDYLSWNTQPKSQKEMLQIIEKGGSDFEPDNKMAYSNSNYVLLSYILEKVYNKPFSKILEENILKPIKLNNTQFGKKIDLKRNDCNSYKYFDKWRIESETDPSVTMGAGGIVSTTGDLNKFFGALFDGKLISENSLRQMTTLKDNCGMGIFQIPFGDKKGYGHSGGIDGFSSFSVYFPEDKLVYSVTANASNYVVNDITIAVLSGVYNKPFEIPEFTAINLKSEDLDKYLGIYSCDQFPIKLTISKYGNMLIGQGTGQAPFNLEATALHIFKFNPAGIVLEFNPTEETMILKQGGAAFLMKKEK